MTVSWFELFYTFLGGLGSFFLGMKMLTESLQLIAGTYIRKIIRTLTTNRILAITVGTLVTTLIQSSSITTVMVVGFVNAGLMQVTQAIGVILGANIGTTITGWIIAIKAGRYGLLLIGVGMIPVLLPRWPRVRDTGKVLVALGLIFLGLKFMEEAFRPLRDTESFLYFMQYFTATTWMSTLACVLVGAGLTFIIQSSSGMLGITIALASSGAITFPTAAALVLGENIGTTVTAWLASLGMNRNAKRAARAHMLFNALGVCWLFFLFPWYVQLVDFLVMGSPEVVLLDGSKPNIAAHIAAGHTLFNVINVIVFLPFVNHLARLVSWMIPESEKETPHLVYVPGMSPTLAIAAAQKELSQLADIVLRGFKVTEEYLFVQKDSQALADRINYYEDVSDKIQAEITRFLVQVQASKVTLDFSAMSHAIIRAADELESIGDYLASIARYHHRLMLADLTFPEEAYKDLKGYFALVKGFYEDVIKDIDSEGPFDKENYLRRVDMSIQEGNRIRSDHLRRMESQHITPSAGLVFSDMVVALRKIRAHALNIVEALSGSAREWRNGRS